MAGSADNGKFVWQEEEEKFKGNGSEGGEGRKGDK